MLRDEQPSDIKKSFVFYDVEINLNGTGWNLG